MEHSTLNLLNSVYTKWVPRPLIAIIIVSISEGRHIDLWSSIFDHRSSTIDHRSSTIDLRPSIFDHRSSKVDTSIFDHRSSIIDHRPSIFDHRSSTIDLRTPIFEDRRWKHRTDNPTSHRQFVTEYCPQRRSIQRKNNFYYCRYCGCPACVCVCA